MIKINETFENIFDMDEFISKYLQKYAPAGYGTNVKISYEQTYDEWKQDKRRYVVEITRFESCD